MFVTPWGDLAAEITVRTQCSRGWWLLRFARQPGYLQGHRLLYGGGTVEVGGWWCHG